MHKNIMIIMNPKAGKGNGRKALFEICNACNAQNDTVSVYITQFQGHALKLVTSIASNFDTIICIGGDGTWNEVINGMMMAHHRIPIAYLPTGTVNDFAASLKISKNVQKFIEHLQNKTFECDIVKFNQKYFTYIAAFGMFSDISYSTPQNAKNTFGKIAYFLEGFKQLAKIPNYQISIRINNETIEDNCIFGCITNSKYVAGFASINYKKTYLDDGLFEVLLIKTPKNPIDVQNIIASLLKHEVNTKWMHFYKASEVVLEAKEAIPWTLDGESGGTIKTAQIKNIHKAIDIII